MTKVVSHDVSLEKLIETWQGRVPRSICPPPSKGEGVFSEKWLMDGRDKLRTRIFMMVRS